MTEPGCAPLVIRRQRRRVLLTMLAALELRYRPAGEPELIVLLRAWFDSWAGIGRVAAGMARQGYDLQLTRYGDEG